MRVELGDDAVHGGAVEARGAPPGLEVVHERGAGDEGARAAVHRAGDGAALMPR